MSEQSTKTAQPIAGHFCGQTQPHDAHVWQTPVPFGSTAISMPRQCAGASAKVPAGPCWHNSGVTWPGQNFPVHCELLAGHAGAHEAEGRAGGRVVWEHSTPPVEEADHG